MDESLRIGKVHISLDRAQEWLARYTDAEENRRSKKPYAFPAYDQLDSGSEPTQLTDGDLLAPQLLNVRISLVAFYGLQRIRPALELALADDRLGQPLVSHDDATIEETVGPLYAVLDRDRPHGVQGTTLSKVLHRKRPLSVVLHDRWVRDCYLGDEPGLVPRAHARGWPGYMVLLTKAIRDDLRREQDKLQSLAERLHAPAALSHLRILDILAWSSRAASAV